MPPEAAHWIKSSYSGSNDNDCVEVASAPHAVVLVRDSKNTHRPHLGFTATAWAGFIPYASER
ncbi:DUF397 domain-containing protein [Streptomyces sp. NPDC059092]|uniref:DUF397 domain-containing protein n=1 Tax=Streptomyces sp. NPDC059092 TaxID=3346725 RepID=UPI0036D0B09A